MKIPNKDRAKRKVAQVGYYRLSGYWYNARKYIQENRKRTYTSDFQQGTSFDDVFHFYLLDKKLRVELTDALERIEIYLRTVIAHEIGREDPMAYKDMSIFNKRAFDYNGKLPNFYDWRDRHEKLLADSKEESIKHYLDSNKELPLWVAAEAWDFGTLSKFYSMLKTKKQSLICKRLDIDRTDVLDNWLIVLNGIRNRCAHHSRLCNRTNPRVLKTPKNGYFNLLALTQNELNRFIGIVAVIWFLLKKIGPSSQWLFRITEIIDSKPNLPGFYFSSLGINTDGFPHLRFTETKNRFIAAQNIDPTESKPQTIEQIMDSLADAISTSKSQPAKAAKVAGHSERLLELVVALEEIENSDCDK